MSRFLALLPLLLLAGCDSRGEPRASTADPPTAPASTARPENATAAKGTGAGRSAGAKAETMPAAKAASAPTDEVQAGWIASFKDAQLDDLVEEAIAANRDLAQAVARREQAQARAHQARSDLGPTIAYAAGAVGDGVPGLGQEAGAGLTFTWEADIWGRLGSSGAASALDQAWARESLAANVAKALFLARLATVHEAIDREVLVEQDRLVKLQTARRQDGQAGDADVAAARAGLDDALQRLTQASVAREQAVRSLELLLGREPKGELVVGDRLPEPPAPPPAGLPSHLIERRPDVVAAMRTVAAVFNQAESTKAARLPRLSLTVGGGLASGEFQRMNADGSFWSAIGNFVGPLYDGGRPKEQVVIEEAKQKEALVAFGQAGLQAFRQVESGLGTGARLEQRAALAKELLATRRQSLTASDSPANAGQGGEEAAARTRLQVLQAEVLVQSLTADQLTARVDLFLAIGGGFTAPAPTRDDAAQPPRVEVR